jgi:hypothetical protein
MDLDPFLGRASLSESRVTPFGKRSKQVFIGKPTKALLSFLFAHHFSENRKTTFRNDA